MRYLTRDQAATNLRLGKHIEQYLGQRSVDGLAVLHWVTLTRDPEGRFLVTLYRARPPEPPDGEVHDIYALWALELDQDRALQPVDAAGKEAIFDDEDGALDYVSSELGGGPDRFLNQGFITDAYNETRQVAR
jgi:hypothetical protein